MKDRDEGRKNSVNHQKVDRSVSLVLSADAIIAVAAASIAAVFFEMKVEFLLAFVAVTLLLCLTIGILLRQKDQQNN